MRFISNASDMIRDYDESIDFYTCSYFDEI